jgi:hypothetical protein
MAIRIRKLGHSHKLTVPTVRKGIGLAQAGRQVAQNKATVNQPGAGYSPYEGLGDMYGSGGSIHIKKANRGKFTAYKERTGKTTAEALHSSNPHVRQMANFARNAKKWHHADGGWIDPNSQYLQGGRIINPVDGGLMIGGQHAYPPTVQYPPMYDFGGTISANNPFQGNNDKLGQGMEGVKGLASSIPAIGKFAAIGTAAGEGLSNFGNAGKTAAGFVDPWSSTKEGFQNIFQGKVSGRTFADLLAPGVGNLMRSREQSKIDNRRDPNQPQDELTNPNNGRPTFAWGGRLPETNSFSPSGLTLGHVPGYDDNMNPGIPPKGFSFRTNTVGRRGEISNWSQDTMNNVQRHQYDEGGEVPVELEKQEVFQEPDGDMGQVNGPSHAEGGVSMQLPENSFVWSDKLKTAKGTTFADEAAKLARMKAKYEKILKA